MRVLQIIPTLATGGLERVATTLALGLAESGDEVVVCTAGRNVLQTNQRALEDAHLPIERIPRPVPRPVPLVRSAAAIARVIRRRQPEIVHAHNPAAALAASAARILAGRPRLPIVTTFHGLARGNTSSAVRVLRRTSTIVVAIGPAAAHDLVAAGLDPARLETVLNAVRGAPVRPRAEVRRELGIDEDAELVATIGRYAVEKNQALLLEAAKLLAPGRPRLRVLLVGTGPAEAQLRATIKRLDLDGLVVMLELRDDPLDVAAAADVATLTSLREGLGLSLIEAMLVGTPVVGTRVGGIPDVVTDGETGLLVSPHDPAELAAALSRLLDDPPLRERLATAARTEVAERFSLGAMVAGYHAAYRRALRV